MWHEELLVKVIARDPIWEAQPTLREVVLRFARTLCPAIIQQYAGKSALGGAGQPLTDAERAALPEGARPLEAADFGRFGNKPDQSLAAHLINGAFAGYRLAALLPPEDFPWTEEQWTLWTLGFVLHDYTKMRGVTVFASRLDAARALCREVGEQLQFTKFFPEWASYLDDIVFVAQNTQKVQGANLNLRDYDLRLPPPKREPLRMLASFADVLVHITEPRDVVAPSAEDGRSTYSNLQSTLRDLLPRERAPRLAYHQMAETRGLLTNLVHNATGEAFIKQGFQPYLYFADGVVYLAPQQGQAQVTVGDVVEQTWQEINKAIASSDTFGIDRDGKGLKVAPPLYEFLNVGELMAAGCSYLVHRVGPKNSSAAERLEKFGATDATLVKDFRVDWLGEYLAYLKRNIAEVVLPQAKNVSTFLLQQLKLEGAVSVAEAERQSGGVPLGWYYAASRFLTLHLTYSKDELQQVMQEIGQAFLAELQRQGLPGQGASKLKDALTSYVSRVLDVDGTALTGEQAPAHFNDELARYLANKSSNRPVCSLCSSPYENEEQTVTVVLFKPQQYSNKNRLGGSRVVRGVCPICSLEMLLRQAKQGAPGGKFQDEKAIYLTLYPMYFFTAEIAELLSEYQRRLEDLNLYRGGESLLAWLRKEGPHGTLNVEHLARFPHFLPDEDDEPPAQKKRRTIRLPPYSDKALHGLALLPLAPTTSDASDTEAWVLPAFYALALPLLLNVKVVASASFVPLYPSGAAFRETVLLDSMHPVVQQALGKEALRVDELLPALKRLLSFYDLHTEVYAEGFDAHWGQLGAVVRDVLTDSYHVFAYYDRKRRAASGETKGAKGKKALNGAGESSREGIPFWDQQKYLDIYYTLKGEPDMGIVGKLVDSYAAFYRAERDKLDSAYSVVKPLSTAIDTTLNSLPQLAGDDLVEVIAGELYGLMERIRDKQADGYAVPAPSAEAARDRIREFASIFVYDLFFKLCGGERANLREQSNRLRSAARFCYLSRYARSRSAGAASSSAANE